LTNNKPDRPTLPTLVESLEFQTANTETAETGKKLFVEPEISSPVDVLEATTFFQGAASGVI